MLLAPPVGFGYNVAGDKTPSAPFGVTLTAGGSAHTMGSWTSIISTITYDLYWVWVTLHEASTAVTVENRLVDLGIGPDASNVTNIADFLMGTGAEGIAGFGRNYCGPLFIPAGTQLWGRCQAAVASDTIACNVLGWGGPDRPASFPVIHKWEAEGENAGATTGTALTPGASGAQGAYSQMVASSAFDYAGCLFAAMSGDTSQAATGYSGEVGIGAATEQDLGTCYLCAHNSNEGTSSVSVPVFADIPSGTRLAARMSCNGTADSTFTGIVYGFRY